MEIHFSPEERGSYPDARFIDAVEEGRAAARRGELLEHDEVVGRIEKIFTS
jgi:predicted transcriptional regulator